jgi:c-di-GMP-binding flagellar brake protein YcgR
MEIGTTLKIQIEGTKSRMTSELIGVETGEYLVIKMPSVQFMGNLSNLLYKGNSITIRYLHKGTIFGFKSHINHFITNPAKLIFIEYPKRIESHDLRGHKRLDCYLPANAKIMDNIMAGTITDISKEGCHLIIDTEKVEVENSLILQVGSKVGISFQLPGVANKLAVTGNQKNVKKDRDRVSLGIEFNSMDIEMQEKLYDFLATANA